MKIEDIPAGRGAASLFLAPAGASRRPSLWLKDEDSECQFVRWPAGPGDPAASRAVWDLIVAALPTVELP